MAIKSEYPNCERLKKSMSKTQVIREFFEFLREKRIELGEWSEGNFDRFNPVRCRLNELIYEFIEVDPEKLERERRLMLDKQRAANERKS